MKNKPLKKDKLVPKKSNQSLPRQKKDEKSLAPKKQSNLERIERISVIIAARLLGKTDNVF